jgi:hypothetical protein
MYHLDNTHSVTGVTTTMMRWGRTDGWARARVHPE